MMKSNCFRTSKVIHKYLQCQNDCISCLSLLVSWGLYTAKKNYCFVMQKDLGKSEKFY